MGRLTGLRAALMGVSLLLGASYVSGAEPAALGEITIVRDLTYRDGCDACKLDLALPTQEFAGPRPVVVIIHGGGWIEGNKSSFSTVPVEPGVAEHPASIMQFARLGFVAATINYRLAREAPYPAALLDCRCAVRWLRANAKKYRIDGRRVGVYGNSAGGHLALLIAMAADKVPRGEPLEFTSDIVQAAISDSGPIDLLYQYEHNQLRTVVETFLGGPPDDNSKILYDLASPSNYVKGVRPPLMLIYGENDEQVPVITADHLVMALSNLESTNVTYLRLAGVGHCPHSIAGVDYLRPAVNEFFVRTLRPAAP